MIPAYYTNRIAETMIAERIKEAALYRQSQERKIYRQKKALLQNELVKTLMLVKLRELKIPS